MLEIIKEILEPQNIWCLSPLLFIILYEVLNWFVAFILAIFNSNAVYDERERRIILELAKDDAMWQRVAKILELESKGE